MSGYIKLQFNLTVDQIKSTTSSAIAAYKEVEDKIASVKVEERSFTSILEPLIHADNIFAIQRASVTFPKNMSSSKEVRDAAAEAEKELSNFDIESGLREDMFIQIRDYYENKKEVLKPEVERYVQRKLRDYRRNGLELPKEKREVLSKLQKELSDICIQFSKNLNEVSTTETFTLEQLAGMPADFIEGLKKSDDGTKYIVGLKYPEVFPILNLCSVAPTRKRMEFLMNSRCLDTNTALIEKAIRLRQEIATLLGYDSYASYRLEERMAKDSKTVKTFLEELHAKVVPGGKVDIEGLFALKQAELAKGVGSMGDPEEDATLNIWDFRYYNNQLLETKFQVNNEEIKKYFPVDKVMEGMFDIYQRLLGLTFKKIDYADVWHADVQVFECTETATGSVTGHFFLDLHPREGKYNHAAVWPLQKGVLLPDGSRQTPVAGMLCNFSRPANAKALLKHNEVTTFFHEFGHVMHNICTKAEIYRFSGTSTERDFVEAPSQMLENWTWEGESLSLMSGHFETGKPLPKELIEKMVAAKNVNVALFTLRQLFFGIFDFTLHTLPPGEKIDTAKLWKDLSSKVFLIPSTPGSNGASSFGHIMGGYDCGYYGYMYSEVFSADMFSLFKEGGILSPELGKRYRDCILSPGGSIDGLDMVKNFLGREPSQEAFLVQRGLLSKST